MGYPYRGSELAKAFHGQPLPFRVEYLYAVGWIVSPGRDWSSRSRLNHSTESGAD
jgi:hypothetical protein